MGLGRRDFEYALIFVSISPFFSGRASDEAVVERALGLEARLACRVAGFANVV